MAAYCATAPCKPLHGALGLGLNLKIRLTPCSNNTWRFVSFGKRRVLNTVIIIIILFSLFL